jgi:exodeoxyribonuclease V alpha subunit
VYSKGDFAIFDMQGSNNEVVRVIGSRSSAFVEGESVHCLGEWKMNPQWGPQFKATTFKHVETNSSLMRSHALTAKFLVSALKGVGPDKATAIIDRWGKDNPVEVLDMLSDASKLAQVKGFGIKSAEMVASQWEGKDMKDSLAKYKKYVILEGKLHELNEYFSKHQLNITRRVCEKILGYYHSSDDAIASIATNPYELVNTSGVSFHTVDEIAGRLGMSPFSLQRFRALVQYCITKHGVVGMPREALLEECLNLVEEVREVGLEGKAGLIREAIAAELEVKHLIAENIDGVDCIFHAKLHHLEELIAHRLVELDGSRARVGGREVDLDMEIKAIEDKFAFNMSLGQREALRVSLHSKLMAVTGGPGSGKTTVLRSVVELFKKQNFQVLLAAPTGRAARNLEDKARYPATTIHRLLGIDKDAKEDLEYISKSQLHKCDLLILDEASMIDLQLFNIVLQALPLHASLILVGDQNQLPSIGPGTILSDFIDSQYFPIVHLTEIFRQGSESAIITAAHDINSGVVPTAISAAPANKSIPHSEFQFIKERYHGIGSTILKVISRESKFFSPRDIQVLCPMHGGLDGTHSLNNEIQKLLNPPGLECIKFGNKTFGVGDKVMQLVNDYSNNVVNGDIGRIVSVIPRTSGDEGRVTVAYDDVVGEKIVTYSEDEFTENVDLAFAMSIHKSQGSEFGVVIIPVLKKQWRMLSRKLLYTAVSRGKEKVIIVGEEAAVQQAVESNRQYFTTLKVRLMERRRETESFLNAHLQPSS